MDKALAISVSFVNESPDQHVSVLRYTHIHVSKSELALSLLTSLPFRPPTHHTVSSVSLTIRILRDMNFSAAEQSIARAFLSAPRFAVVGASKDQSKFGTRVLKWYQV